MAVEKGEVGLGQLGRAPAEREGVECHDQDFVAVNLGTMEKAGCGLFTLRLGPIALVPEVAAIACVGDLLQSTSRCCRDDHKHSQATGSYGGSFLGVLVDDLLNAYWCHKKRAWVFVTEELDTGVSSCGIN